MGLLSHSPSVCFLIFRVTVSPAICSKWMASLRGFPFKLLLLMARIRSPMWIAPVLEHQTGVEKGDKFPICLHINYNKDLVRSLKFTSSLLLGNAANASVVNCFLVVSNKIRKSVLISCENGLGYFLNSKKAESFGKLLTGPQEMNSEGQQL